MAGLTIEDTDAGLLSWLRPRRRDIAGQCVVLSDSIIGAVTAAGGWLFDQRVAGCKTAVVLTSQADDRALRILGAAAIDLDIALAAEPHDRRPKTLVLCANLFQHDTRVRQAVFETVGNGHTTVMMWADSCPIEFQGSARRVEHRLTIAARAFKREALAAAGASSDSLGFQETFCAVGPGPADRTAPGL